MNPCELNWLVAALTNWFYDNLTDKEFYKLSVFLRELSRTMLTMAVYEEIGESRKKQSAEK